MRSESLRAAITINIAAVAETAYQRMFKGIIAGFASKWAMVSSSRAPSSEEELSPSMSPSSSIMDNASSCIFPEGVARTDLPSAVISLPGTLSSLVVSLRLLIFLPLQLMLLLWRVQDNSSTNALFTFLRLFDLREDDKDEHESRAAAVTALWLCFLLNFGECAAGDRPLLLLLMSLSATRRLVAIRRSLFAFFGIDRRVVLEPLLRETDDLLGDLTGDLTGDLRF